MLHVLSPRGAFLITLGNDILILKKSPSFDLSLI